MAAVSKNVLDDIVNKYNNTIYRTIKMKPIDATSDSYTEYNKDSNVTRPKFKARDYLGFQTTKTFLLNGTLKIGQKFLLLAKLRIQFCGHA